ncbi:MAG: hypothetical protein WBO08_18615 [Mycobacterium sp.]
MKSRVAAVVSILRGDRLSHLTKAIIYAVLAAVMFAISAWAFLSACSAPARAPERAPERVDTAQGPIQAGERVTADDGCRIWTRLAVGDGGLWSMPPVEKISLTGERLRSETLETRRNDLDQCGQPGPHWSSGAPDPAAVEAAMRDGVPYVAADPKQLDGCHAILTTPDGVRWPVTPLRGGSNCDVRA